MRLTTQGIVLRETNYKEADKILTVLTRDWGKRTVKARGCRRKNSKLTAASQLLVYSELTLSERGEFTTLTEADPLEQFWSVRQDLETLALASYFAEVAEASAQEGETCPELLSLLLNCLYALDTLKKPRALVKAVFELRLLCLTGYEPLLDACAVCGAPEPLRARLHLSQGVLCCAACPGAAGGRGVHAPVPGGPGGGPVHCLGPAQEALLLCPGGGEPPAAGAGHGGLSDDPAGAGVPHIGLL